MNQTRLPQTKKQVKLHGFAQPDGTILSDRKVFKLIRATGRRIEQTAKGILIYSLLLFTLHVCGQTKTVKDADGNYIQTKEVAVKTGKTFTNYQGKVYPIYRSARGKEFVYFVSKKGNTYKVYLNLK